VVGVAGAQTVQAGDSGHRSGVKDFRQVGRPGRPARRLDHLAPDAGLRELIGACAAQTVVVLDVQDHRPNRQDQALNERAAANV
jgi:hypothetical protein